MAISLVRWGDKSERDIRMCRNDANSDDFGVIFVSFLLYTQVAMLLWIEK